MKLTTRLVAFATLIALVALGSLTSMRPRPVDAQFPTPDLRAVKIGPATVAPGGTITYTITISNDGTAPAEMITFTDLIPANTTFVSWSQTSGPTFVLNQIGAPVTTVTAQRTLFLLVGESAVFSLVVTANAGLTDGTVIANGTLPSICRVATTSTAFPDLNPGNNTCAFDTTVVVPLTNLGVTKTDAPDPVQPTSNITYIVTLSNLTAVAASTVVLTDAVPANTTFVSATQTSGTPAFTPALPAVGGTGNITFSAASVPGGSIVVFTIVVRVDAGVANGLVISNTASVTTTTPETSAANNSATATTTVTVPPTDLAVTKTDSPDPVQANNVITYTVTLSNAGTITANNVVLTDVVPGNTTFVSAVQSSGTPAFTPATPPAGGTGPITFTAATMPGGSTVAFTIMVRVNAPVTNGTVITNTATVATTTAEANLSNNTATATTLVVTPAPATPTPVPPTVTPVPFVPLPPQVFQNPAIGGIFNGSRNNTPTPVRPAAVAPVTAVQPMPMIQPPSTGDAGLDAASNSAIYGLAIIATLTVLSLGVARVRRVRK